MYRLPQRGPDPPPIGFLEGHERFAYRDTPHSSSLIVTLAHAGGSKYCVRLCARTVCESSAGRCELIEVKPTKGNSKSSVMRISCGAIGDAGVCLLRWWTAVDSPHGAGDLWV